MSNRLHQPTPSDHSPARTNSAHTFPAPLPLSMSSKKPLKTNPASGFHHATSIPRSIQRHSYFAYQLLTTFSESRLWTRSWLIKTGRPLCGLLKTRHLCSKNVSLDLPELFISNPSLSPCGKGTVVPRRVYALLLPPIKRADFNYLQYLTQSAAAPRVSSVSWPTRAAWFTHPAHPMALSAERSR